MTSRLTLIVPMAGLSTRFPGTRPKWLLTTPSGDLMCRACVDRLDFASVHEVVYVMRQDHAAAVDAVAVLARQMASNPLPVPYRTAIIAPTASQPETVAAAIDQLAIRGPIFIKDVDNRFACAPTGANEVAVADLSAADRTSAASKSYVEVNDLGRITTIVEKRVVSSTFCVGGYGFASADDFTRTFGRLRHQPDLYVSHVIYAMLLEGVGFAARPVEGYEDWGTLTDWQNAQRRAGTLFVDLDGTLVRSSAEFFAPHWGETDALARNVAALNRLAERDDVRIVITTSRKASAEAVTRAQLERIGLRYHAILFDLPHARRYLVNDWSASNPNPSAVAINIVRDTETLEEHLDTWFPGPE